MLTKFWESILILILQMRKQMGKKLNDLFKATLQINLKLGLCGWLSCLMFLFSNVMIWCQVNPWDPGLRSILYLRVLLWGLQTFPLKFRVWNETCFTLIKKKKIGALICVSVLCAWHMMMLNQYLLPGWMQQMDVAWMKNCIILMSFTF